MEAGGRERGGEEDRMRSEARNGQGKKVRETTGVRGQWKEVHRVIQEDSFYTPFPQHRTYSSQLNWHQSLLGTLIPSYY